VVFIRALKRLGRFVVPGPAVVISGRKLRTYSARQILGEACRWAVSGPGSFRRREDLNVWYGERPPDRGRLP
jgi:hypothetical protein